MTEVFSTALRLMPANSSDIRFVNICKYGCQRRANVSSMEVSIGQIVWRDNERVAYVLASRIGSKYRIEQIAIHPDFAERGLETEVLQLLLTIADEKKLEMRAKPHGAISEALLQEKGFQSIEVDRSLTKIFLRPKHRPSAK